MKKVFKIILLVILGIIASFLIFWSTCTVVLFIPNLDEWRIALWLFIPAVILLIPTILGIKKLIKNLKKKD